MQEKKKLCVGFIGNPNCGKTTLFNAYTGANLKVANWPGVTVERVEGRMTYKDWEIKLIDLPGTYSLTSYTHGRKGVPEMYSQRRGGRDCGCGGCFCSGAEPVSHPSAD